MRKKFISVCSLVLSCAMLFLTACGEENGEKKGKEITVSFVTGTQDVVSSRTVEVGKVYGLLPMIQQEGYDFLGWYTGATEGTQITARTVVSLETDHSLYAWWQAEESDPEPEPEPEPEPIILPEPVTPETAPALELDEKVAKISIDAGSNYSLVVDENGELWGWGENFYSQTGIKYSFTSNQRNIETPTSVTDYVSLLQDVSFAKVSAGAYHSLAIDTDGYLWGWGSNGNGQLGISGGSSRQEYPALIMDNTKFIEIAAGSNYSLAIDENGNLWAFGTNGSGQLGDGTKEEREAPVQIMVGTQFKKVAASVSSSFAIDKEGNLWTWGRDLQAEDTSTYLLEPKQILKGMKFTEISVGSLHVLAADEEGNVWAWGYNTSSAIGMDASIKKVTEPVKLMQNVSVKTLSAGSQFSFVLDKAGRLWGWGAHGNGQLGAVPKEAVVANNFLSAWRVPTPTQIESDTRFVQVSAGSNHTIAIDENGKIWSWGSDSSGQIGDGGYGNTTTPTQIKASLRFSYVTATSSTAYAIDTEGNLVMWGSQYDLNIRNYPEVYPNGVVSVMEGTRFTTVASSNMHTLALDAEGNIWAWGSNSSGQLGDGTTVDAEYTAPVKVKKNVKFTQIATLSDTSYALDENGSLWAWGDATFNRLANDSKEDSKTLKQVKMGTKFKSVVSSGSSMYALTEEGALWQWGLSQDEIMLIIYPSLTDLRILGEGTQFKELSPCGTYAIDINGVFWKLVAYSDRYTGNLCKIEEIAWPLRVKRLYKKSIIDESGNLWVWGDNSYGEVGDGTTEAVDMSAPVMAMKKVKQCVSGSDYTMAIDEEGKLWAWGSNLALPFGEVVYSRPPVMIQLGNGE